MDNVWLGIDLSKPCGCVVQYTDPQGDRFILGFGIIVNSSMKYISRGPGIYEIIYNARPFDDVPIDAYYTPYVKWATENDIILGVSATKFEPERAVTRQEMATMMYRFMKHRGLTFKNNESIQFNDIREISEWAQEGVKALQDTTGIIGGRPGNLFNPNAASTRAEVATILRRLVEYILK